MKKIILFICLFVFIFSNAQIKNLYKGKLDSVVMKNYSYYDKETSTINDTIQNYRIELLKSKKLTQKGIIILIEKLKSYKSYSKKRALLSHSDIKIFFYFNNKIVQDLIYSSITKNLTINKKEDCIFNGQATLYLQKEINKLSRVR